jgi:hypothetical protein
VGGEGFSLYFYAVLRGSLKFLFCFAFLGTPRVRPIWGSFYFYKELPVNESSPCAA